MNHFEFEIFENCWSSYIKVINADSASILQGILNAQYPEFMVLKLLKCPSVFESEPHPDGRDLKRLQKHNQLHYLMRYNLQSLIIWHEKVER